MLKKLMPMKRMMSKFGKVGATKGKGECNKIFDTRASATKYSKLG